MSYEDTYTRIAELEVDRDMQVGGDLEVEGTLTAATVSVGGAALLPLLPLRRAPSADTPAAEGQLALWAGGLYVCTAVSGAGPLWARIKLEA